MQNILELIVEQEEMFMISVIAIMVVLIVSIKAFTRMISNLATERTRREIAAYIAEGSMTPEQGEKLLASGSKSGRGGCG